MNIGFIKNFYLQHEGRISSLALIAGFTLDNLTLTRIDLYLDNIILIAYLLVAAAGIAIVNLYQGGVVRGRFVSALEPWLPLPIQFAFGGLFSGFLVFYLRSASLFASWPFLLFLFFLLIGNEFFRKRYERLIFQVSIFFIVLYSYMIFFVPIVVNRLGAMVFVLSTAVSVVIVALLLYGLYTFLPQLILKNRWALVFAISGIVIVMNVLYFSNVLPPIPLSLKEAGVYHSIVKDTANRYHVLSEKEAWFKRLIPGQEIHIVPGEPVYVFSSVFAPTDIAAGIVHEWQYRDNNNWVTSSRIQFPITGGRDGGYRGYSLKRNVFEGAWRVNVENERGQKLGSVRFFIDEASENPVLIESVI